MLRGTLDDFSLPDIFRLVSYTKKTGKLEVRRSAGDGKVFFRDGEVYFAQSSLKREPLGQKLIRQGALTEGQLRKALDLNAATGQRVGEILLEQGAITEEQLIAAVKGQIEDACFDLLRWELGEFDFETHERFTVEIPISVSVENLIMEASRRLDELDMIRRKIPSPEVVLAVAPTPPEGAREINIAPDEWRLLVLVDGQRTVGEICSFAGLDEFVGLKTLYGLLSSGLVDVASMGPEPAPSPIAHPAPIAAEPPAAPPPPAPEEREPGIVRGPDPIDTADEMPPPPPALEIDEIDEPVPGTVRFADESDELEAAVDEAEPAEQGFQGPDMTPESEAVVPPGPVAPEWRDEPVPGPVAPEWLDEPPAGPVAPEWRVEEPLAGPVAPAWNDALSPAVESLGGELALEPQPVEPFEGFDGTAAVEEAVPEEPTDAEGALPDWLRDPGEVSTNGSDPTLDELAGEPEADVEADAAGEEPPIPEPAPDLPVSLAPSSVDRAAVVRELTSLFSDEEEPGERDDVRSGPATKRRVEDDDQINKGLIGRFIDGVKGM